MIDLVLTIVGFVAGAIVSWLFARQSSKELRAMNDALRSDNAALKRIAEKIPTELHALIANDPRSMLTTQQVAQLATTVAQLQDQNAPRRLMSDQRERLVAEIRKFEPKAMRIVSAGDDDEADHFRDQLVTTFRDAGWPVGGGTAIAAMDVNGLSLDYFAGHLSSAPPTDETIRLQPIFDRAGLKVRTRPLPENERDMHWLLSVGHKPRMPLS